MPSQTMSKLLTAIENDREERISVGANLLVKVKAELHHLIDVLLPQRYEGRSGRYRKYDTARLTYVRTIALPRLMYGKLPTSEAWGFLFMHPDPDKNSAVDKALNAWAKEVHPDPRSVDTSLAAGMRQTSLIEHAFLHANDFRSPSQGPCGRPREYRFTFLPFKDKTIYEVATITTKHRSFNTGLSFLQWVCGDDFTWHLKNHYTLYIALSTLERERTYFRQPGSGGEWMVALPRKVHQQNEKLMETECFWAKDAAMHTNKVIKNAMSKDDQDKLCDRCRKNATSMLQTCVLEEPENKGADDTSNLFDDVDVGDNVDVCIDKIDFGRGEVIGVRNVGIKDTDKTYVVSMSWSSKAMGYFKLESLSLVTCSAETSDNDVYEAQQQFHTKNMHDFISGRKKLNDPRTMPTNIVQPSAFNC